MSSTFDQYRHELDALRFSDAALERMTIRLQDASASTTAKRPTHRILRIAASLLIATGIGLGATGAHAVATQHSLSTVFSDIFGSAPAQTEIIEKIGRPIGATVTNNGVTVTADAIIGSSNSCTIVFSISRDNGKPFPNLTPAGDSTFPLLWSESSAEIDGTRGLGSGAYFYDADPSDSSIQYVYTITNATAPDGNGLTGRTTRVHLSDLLMASEEADNTELIAKGSWDLKFQLDYQDSSVAIQAGQKLEFNGMSVTLDKLSVSPVGASITYTVDAVSTDSQGPDELPSDKFTRLPFIVTLTNGRTLDGTDADASTRERGASTIVTKSFMFDAIVNVSDIASVTVGDQVVPVR